MVQTACSVNEVCRSGVWAYVMFAADDSKQVDVLHDSITLTTWIPDRELCCRLQG